MGREGDIEMLGDGRELLKKIETARVRAAGMGLAASELALRRAILAISRELRLPCELSDDEKAFSEALDLRARVSPMKKLGS